MKQYIRIDIKEILAAAAKYPDCDFLQDLAARAEKSRDTRQARLAEKAERALPMARQLALWLEFDKGAANQQCARMREQGKLDIVRLLRNLEVVKFYGCFYYDSRRGWRVKPDWREALK